MHSGIFFYGRRLLFIGAHPDDIELGCGAMIAQVSQKTEVLCVTLSDNQKNPSFPILYRNNTGAWRSWECPGITPSWNHLKPGAFRRSARKSWSTCWIFGEEIFNRILCLSTKADIHQDHGTVTEEALRAFRGTTVLGFDVLRNSYGFFPNFLVEVSEQDVEHKIQALGSYHTYDSRYYFDPEILRATLIRHGALAERKYAEGFDILNCRLDFECMHSA